MPIVDCVEAHQRGEQPDVSLGELVAGQETLAGEALLMRSWTKPLVPETVKKNLPQFDQSAGEGEAKPAQTAAAQ